MCAENSKTEGLLARTYSVGIARPSERIQSLRVSFVKKH